MAWRCIGSALSGYSRARIQQGQAGPEAWILMLSSPRNISTSCLFCLSVSSPCTAILVFCLFVFMPLYKFILSREVITTLLYWHQPSLISTHLDHLCEYFCGKGITASRITLAKSWSSNPFHIQQLLLSVHRTWNQSVLSTQACSRSDSQSPHFTIMLHADFSSSVVIILVEFISYGLSLSSLIYMGLSLLQHKLPLL